MSIQSMQQVVLLSLFHVDASVLLEIIEQKSYYALTSISII